MSEYVEAFTIFTKHGSGNFDLCAEHDEIFVQCSALDENSADGKRLQELRWRPNGEGIWAHFV